MENSIKMSSAEVINQALKKQYPSMSDVNRKIATREMVFAPEHRMIEIDETRKMSAKDLSFMTAHTLEMPLDGGLVEKYAHNIEVINSAIDPEAEYFAWLNETTLIIHELNDGFISQDDAILREKFLEVTDQRETDLMVCLSLYESCKSKEAEDRIKFIRYKLQKLREMRAAIKFLTRQGQDEKTTNSEYDAAIPYYKYFKKLQKLPFGYDMTYEQKMKYDICFGEDVNVAESHEYYEAMLNEMLDEMKAKDIAKSENTKNFKQNSEEDEVFTRR